MLTRCARRRSIEFKQKVHGKNLFIARYSLEKPDNLSFNSINLGKRKDGFLVFEMRSHYSFSHIHSGQAQSQAIWHIS